MPRIGVTGHVRLAEGTAELVYAELVATLTAHGDGALHGVTCLADGADQLFARAVAALGGTYEVILPATDYRTVVGDRKTFDDLLGKAVHVDYAPFATSEPAAYFAASELLLRRVDHLVAVWDGQPSDVVSSTANVVRTARDHGLPVTVIWPAGARRA
ncbi:hypothetical protein Ais01nite_58090 [Asanoa ishikariensis]|uniref:Uncharacterized protein n=1 Tax=Asanoa ishikariensis TaxID=137265 RepID=A0A1H3TZS8_9ACTN|nr:hypothetical protein [Asanoa ishikariensis]GIF67774.1 hypothetical protein Ais01nite_58090 [Asanoa ishikariensis]SDZ55756.1 hypothetical protein SAMN05421684_6671 [Asanoa ishikariensis]